MLSCVAPLHFIRLSSLVGEPKLAATLGVLGCASLVLGAKFWLIGANGSITPFWDQWDGEAAALYRPYLSGELSWLDLFDAHNEHRIFFTRALALLLLEFSGQWDTLLQMLVNAIVHVASIALLLIALGRVVPAAAQLGLCLFTGVLFAIPFGWENTLGGFQSPFYFLLLCSIGAIILLVPAPSLGARWWIGTGIALSSALCLASGALTLVPIIGVRVLQLLLRVRRGGREWAGLVVHLLATVVAILILLGRSLLLPVAPPSIELFTSALQTLVEWPLPSHWWAPILIYSPLLLLFGAACVRRSAADQPIWTCLVIGAWALIQLACFVYGRTFAPLASRYLDVLLVGIVASFAAAFFLILERPARLAVSFAAGVATFIWIAVIFFHLLNAAMIDLPPAIASKRETGLRQTANVRAFLLSGDPSLFTNKPLLDVPYPIPDRLVALLQDPTIRAILPRELGGARSNEPNAGPNLAFKGRFASAAASFKTALLQGPALLLSGSLAFFVFAGFVAAHRRTASFNAT